MARSADVSHFRNGDLVWSPNGTENEWCEIYNFVSVTSWSFFRPSNGATGSGPKSLLLYPPSQHRPASPADRPAANPV